MQYFYNSTDYHSLLKGYRMHFLIFFGFVKTGCVLKRFGLIISIYSFVISGVTFGTSLMLTSGSSNSYRLLYSSNISIFVKSIS